MDDARLAREVIGRARQATGCPFEWIRGPRSLFEGGRHESGYLIAHLDALKAQGTPFRDWLADPLRRVRVLALGGDEDADGLAGCIESGAELHLRLPAGERLWSAVLGRLVHGLATPSPEEALDEPVALESPPLQAIYGRIRSLAHLEGLNLHIAGETGTGKQEMSRLVHRLSRRRDGPFAEIDCTALPLSLMESELFGHEAGAYTDARQARMGLFEEAQGGTLFLDEVGELHLEAQAKLLRTLELRRFRRLGGTREIRLDIRLISASNRDLAQEVRVGRFRADLYYRLNGVTLQVPPLRERPEDIETLAGYFYGRACTAFGRPALPLGGAVLGVLKRHSWPGNIRELKSLMQRAVALSPPGRELQAALVRSELGPAGERGEDGTVPTLRQAEERLVRQALGATGGNKTAAARLMGISKPTFFRMLREFGVNL